MDTIEGIRRRLDSSNREDRAWAIWCVAASVAFYQGLEPNGVVAAIFLGFGLLMLGLLAANWYLGRRLSAIEREVAQERHSPTGDDAT